MPVFVVRTADASGQSLPGIFDELEDGRARLGCSRSDRQDLRLIRDRINDNAELDATEREARGCLPFLSSVDVEDYLIYPHQPYKGKLSVVQITGAYDYSKPEEELRGDFRSYRNCRLITPDYGIDRYATIVSARLRREIGRPRSIYQLDDPAAFFTFLEEHSESGTRRDDPARDSIRKIHQVLRHYLLQLIRMEFAAHDFSGPFCAGLLERMGYAADVQEGSAESGPDIVAAVTHPLVPPTFRIGVQVFGFHGAVEETQLVEKLDRLLLGWTRNSLDYGVLLTTGACTEEARTAVSDHNENNRDRPVRLIEGDDLVDLFLKHFPPVTE